MMISLDKYKSIRADQIDLFAILYAILPVSGKSELFPAAVISLLHKVIYKVIRLLCSSGSSSALFPQFCKTAVKKSRTIKKKRFLAIFITNIQCSHP